MAARSKLWEHYRRARVSPYYKRSRYIVMPETNNDWGKGDDYAKVAAIALRDNMEVVSGDTDKERCGKGVYTTKAIKEEGCRILQEALNNNFIHFAENIVSGNVAADKNELLAQLSRFRRVADEPTSVHAEARTTLTGKGPGGVQDDLASGLQILLAFTTRLMQMNPNYFMKS